MLNNSDFISALASQKDIHITSEELKFVTSKEFDAITFPIDHIVINQSNYLFKAHIGNHGKVVYFRQHGG